jgi:hypothetical protein
MKDEALKLALEALGQMQAKANFECWNLDICDKAITAIKQALAAPVQEPVAWLQVGLAPFHDGDVIARTSKPKAWNPEWWRFEPLYTTPPAAQRPWVGLTDEERWVIFEKNQTINSVIKAIEAKLKEKNTAAQPAVPDAFGTREGEHPKYIQGWNDCRAEMLKGMKP